MNVFASFHAQILTAVETLQSEGALPADLPVQALTVETPRDTARGDIATNAAMALAKPAGAKPRDIAGLIAPRLAALDSVSDVEIAGPGFINVTLTDAFWRARLDDILGEGTGYGASTLGAGDKVNVEYVSANPTGPMHVGHCRGAVVGDAVANLLEKAGYAVTKEYYINDAGAQIDVLARSAYLRYCEARGRDIGAIPEGLYPGDYLVEVGRRLAEIHGDAWLDQPDHVWMEPIRYFATEAMMDLIRDDLAALGVEHEVFFSERELHESGRIERTLTWLAEHDLVYEGVLEPPKGKQPEDWEPRPQLLFKATDFGDDVDRPLKKSSGDYTYFAADIAYHDDKYRRGFHHMVLVLGADHGGYAKRMEAAVKAVSGGEASLSIQFCQLVKLLRHGAPVKMSKRAGSFVTLREVVDEVGRDVVRFIMLTRKNDAPLDFDFAKALEQSRDNPVWYVQYAHARANSAFRKAAALFPSLAVDPAPLRRVPAERLTEPEELDLIKRLTQWPRVDPDLTQVRLKVVQAAKTVIASGLAVLGVTPVDELT